MRGSWRLVRPDESAVVLDSHQLGPAESARLVPNPQRELVVIGAAVGALAAGVLLYVLRDLDLSDEPGTAGFGVGTVIGVELIGIGTGGLIGLGIGSLIPKWHRRYP